jgi:acetolactate decarboxylase
MSTYSVGRSRKHYVYSLLNLDAFTLVNVAGYHLHFITQDKQAGGHLLDCQLQNVRAEIDYTPAFNLVLPNSKQFRQADLGDGKPAEVDRVER